MANWEKKEANKGELTFEISVEQINDGLDKAFNKTKKDLRVPGFRKGKVSRQVFNKMYGEESLYQEALNFMLPEAYAEALKETNVDAVDQPEISVESMEKGQPWVIKATVSVKPEAKLGQYKDLTVEKQNTRVYAKDIDAKLEEKQKSQAELVLKDKPAENGDTVVIDFEGFVDGKAFEGGQSNNYSLELGSNSFIPGFEDQLVGKKAEDETDVKVTFPEEYQAKELAGKEATFKVKVHEVKQQELPELDDEFAKDVDESVDNLEELKAKIKEELKEEKTNAAKEAIENDAITQAVDNAEVNDIPQSMIDSDIQRQMDQYLASMQQQGINEEMFFQLTGTSRDDLKKQFTDGADRRVKTNIVLEEIVKAEKIEPSQEDIDAEIKNLAGQYGMEESAIRGALTDDMLKHDIGVQKAVQLITDSAKQESKSK
ncbi:trigger factor [Lactobacillus sp. S2-2]|uniref:trigger factor n=1 Tax=Lactobacillus sp. S2-2 TaxID=2692917 RepID=UPI001F01197A|nr:trigger factor [Lactobacillus sp. S2-2]MCF6514898.1 trigger factor [Lactobacillus sp. S2-2]